MGEDNEFGVWGCSMIEELNDYWIVQQEFLEEHSEAPERDSSEEDNYHINNLMLSWHDFI